MVSGDPSSIREAYHTYHNIMMCIVYCVMCSKFLVSDSYNKYLIFEPKIYYNSHKNNCRVK